MENADQDKYGSILTGLNTQKTLKNDQYPKTVTDANNVLSCHRFDQGYKKPKQRKDINKEKKNDKNKEGTSSMNTPLRQFTSSSPARLSLSVSPSQNTYTEL